MAERCVTCGLKSRGRYSPLGQPLCERHYTEILGMVVGAEAGGLGGAVVGPSMLRWAIGSLNPKRSKRLRGRDAESPTKPDES